LGKVRVFRCRICQEPYIGTKSPSRCPFCGASQKHFIDAVNWDWSQYNIEISETSKANLERALKLELDNTAFYSCARNAAQKALDEYGYAKFKALMKIENEHAEVICKALGIKEPALEEIECSGDYLENTQKGWDREDRAIKAYAGFAEEAPEALLKTFFNALVEIEKDHLDLHAENLKN
jgi:rubrerythrin